MKLKLPVIGEIRSGKDVEGDITIIREEVKGSKKAVGDSLGTAFTTSGRLSDQKTVSKKVLQANKGWVYKNNDVIAKEVSNIEFELYRIDFKGGEILYTPIKEHPLLDDLNRFNDSTTKNDGIYVTQSHKKLAGDAFWYLDWQGNQLKNIYALQPDCVTLKIGDPTDSSDELVEGYNYKQTIDNKQVERNYTPDEIIHFKTPNPNNMFRGLGAVEAMAETIDLDNLTTEVSRKFFDQGAITNFILSTPNKLTEEQLKRLKAEYRAAYGGARNAFSTMILGGDLKPSSISMSNKDMEFLAQLEWYRDKIMVGFGNTKASLGLIDDVNRASFDSSIASWKANTIRPDMAAIVNTLNEFLVPRYGDRLVLGFKDPVPEDYQSKINQNVQLREADIITRDEARQKLGYEERGGQADLLNIEQAPSVDVPAPLKHIDLPSVLRKHQVYTYVKEYKDLKRSARAVAEKIVKSRKKKDVKPVILPEHNQFDNEKVWAYWEKQIKVVEIIEQRFRNVANQWIGKVVDQILANVDEYVDQQKSVNKQLVDDEQMVIQAGVDFTPILLEVATISGQQAMQLIDSDDPYIPLNARKSIERNIKKFAKSAVKTDEEAAAKIIDAQLQDGSSVPKIRKALEEHFDELSKVQAERITRTEVLRVSNEAAVDAWDQSGVVEGKQWLTAEDDRVDEECAELNGEVIGLTGAYAKDSFGRVEEPPLHPNCRCVVLPVLVGEKAFVPEPIHEKQLHEAQKKELEAEIESLKAQVDKRTKAYKELKDKQLDPEALVGELKELLTKSEKD